MVSRKKDSRKTRTQGHRIDNGGLFYCHPNGDGKKPTGATQIAAGVTDPAANAIDALWIAAAGEDRGNGLGEGIVTEALAIGHAVNPEAINYDVVTPAKSRSSDHVQSSRDQIAAAALAVGSVIVSRRRAVGTEKRHSPSGEYAANNIRDL